MAPKRSIDYKGRKVLLSQTVLGHIERLAAEYAALEPYSRPLSRAAVVGYVLARVSMAQLKAVP